jgi:hypothetical protein
MSRALLTARWETIAGKRVEDFAAKKGVKYKSRSWSSFILINPKFFFQQIPYCSIYQQ